MKHCIIMTAYKDVEIINHFISLTPKDWGIYIHLDKKSKLRISDINPRAKVFSIKKIYWGGWEHLYVFWFLLNQAKESGTYFDYYHLISGQDFYASPIALFDELLGNEGMNYMGIFSIPNRYWHWDGGYKIFKYRTLSSFCDIRKTFPRAINKIYYLLQKYTHTERRLPPYPLFGSSVYSSLHHDFVEWMLDSDLAKSLLHNLKNSVCAEEVFFQTVIMNSPFKQKVKAEETLRYVDWHSNPRPKFLDTNDFEKIKNSGSLFCRKVDSQLSRGLISLLENYAKNGSNK